MYLARKVMMHSFMLSRGVVIFKHCVTQAQTNSLNTGLGTNWVTVSGSSDTNQFSVPINTTNDSLFFRLIYP